MTNLPAVREENAFELGKVFAESGMFPNVKKAGEAIVKILAGREFQLGPVAAMNGIHMVEGKPTLSANLIAGQIKRHPRYDYKVIRREPNGCELEFFEDGKPVGHMVWDKTNATAAGLLGKMNWKKYAPDMYFARCLTAGARTFCPDVLGGSPIYTAEELGADETVHGAEGAPALEPIRPPLPGYAPEPIEDVEVVPDEPALKAIDVAVLAQLRETYTESKMTESELCWLLLSVGVESLPADPTKEDVGAAMRGLTLEQAFKLDALLKGEDEDVPGSSEKA